MSKLTRYDMININQFKDGKQAGYLCSMCGQYTTLHDSASYEGYNLVCNRCIYKMGSILDVTIGNIIIHIQAKGMTTEKNEKKGGVKVVI